ncbi:MAG: peptidoglycan-binding domain-containing protein [Polyangiaceae bacterium]
MAPTYLPYIVHQGDYVDKLAAAAGADPDEVWNHPKNAELRGKRASKDVLCPGDIIYLPSGPRDGLDCDRGTTNRYVAKVKKRQLAIVFDDTEQPHANLDYEIRGLPKRPGDQNPRGKTDGDGKTTLEVPVFVRHLTLYFPALHHEVALSIGDLDPTDESSGVVRRLQNLHFLAQLETEPKEMHVTRAIRDFQAAYGLEVTGVADEPTQKMLIEKAGS